MSAEQRGIIYSDYYRRKHDRSIDIRPESQDARIWREGVDFVEEGFNPERSLRDTIERIVSDPEAHLGSGGAGKVYEIGEGTCIKIMKNRHGKPNSNKYNLGNTIMQEAHIQHMLHGFDVAGVYAPAVAAAYEGEETGAIIMEQLDAVNLQLVLLGKEQRPTNFELHQFFADLTDYIETMHEEIGIVHGDMEARNVMIDQKTGKPRVIDFGRSRVLSEVSSEVERDRMKDAELSDVDTIYNSVEKWLADQAMS